jgi:tetratricopeptide (TPR) repeat protein
MRSLAAFVVLFSLFFLPVPASAQNIDDLPTWKTLDDAKALFEGGDFGDALTACEQARKNHAALVSSLGDQLKKYLAPAAVRKAGDSIEKTIEIFRKRNEDDAVALIDSLLKKRSAGYFNDSVSAMLSWLASQAAYPEADFLSGRIYEAEGESDVAFSFYEKAWTNRALLDIPDDRIDIAFRMADLARDTGNPGAQEKYLLKVLSEDPAYGKQDAESPTLRAMIRTLETDRTPDRFFSLYRHDNESSLKACKDLAIIYVQSGRIDRAFPVAVFSACISTTLLSKTVAASDFNYEFTTLPDLMERAGKKAEIAVWAREAGIWDSFEVLARTLGEHGKADQSRALWSILAQSCPDPAVARRASRELSKTVSLKNG